MYCTSSFDVAFFYSYGLSVEAYPLFHSTLSPPAVTKSTKQLQSLDTDVCGGLLCCSWTICHQESKYKNVCILLKKRQGRDFVVGAIIRSMLATG